jgi:hypothetical protein
MAVIKIVPMPGAEGQQGETGAVGPQGPQGNPGVQGPAGADAVWYYNGEYNPGASYVIGDVVTYDGQLWYRKHANGGNVGDTPSEGLFWDLIAAKGEPGLNGLEGDQGPQGEQGIQGEPGPQGPAGADGSQLNYWNFIGDPGVPAEDGAIVVDGISGRTGGNAVVFAESGGSVILAGTNGEFLNDSNFASNQIATIGDITTAVGVGNNGEVTRWSPNFKATGLVFTGTNSTYPTYNSHYVKNGRMVSFWIEVDLATVTNFGTGQYIAELPFMPLTGTMNHFQAWANVDPTVNPDIAGHVVLQADHLANTKDLDLHYLKQAGGANSPLMEAMFKQGTPATLTTSSKIYINGTYITAE